MGERIGTGGILKNPKARSFGCDPRYRGVRLYTLRFPALRFEAAAGTKSGGHSDSANATQRALSESEALDDSAAAPNIAS